MIVPKTLDPDIGSFLYLENLISLSLKEETRGSIREDPSQRRCERAKGKQGEEIYYLLTVLLDERRLCHE